MATSKTKGTSAKIKELKGIKPEKITEDQLKKVQDVIKNTRLHIILQFYKKLLEKLEMNLKKNTVRLILIYKMEL